MTYEQAQKLSRLELLVKELLGAYDEERESCARLRQQVEEQRQANEELKRQLDQLKAQYETLRTARILEVSGDDVKDARRRLARLISEVDKCIALINV